MPLIKFLEILIPLLVFAAVWFLPEWIVKTLHRKQQRKG